jgi:hypothetical protein
LAWLREIAREPRGDIAFDRARQSKALGDGLHRQRGLPADISSGHVAEDHVPRNLRRVRDDDPPAV